MPWSEYDDKSVYLQFPGGEPLMPERAGPSIGDVFGAAFDRENLVYNMARKIGMERNPVVPGYNPIVDERVKGTRYENQYLDRFTNSFSPDDTAQIIADIEREEKDAEMLSAGGAVGLAAGAVAGMLDPTIFMPGGAVYRAGKGGYSAVRTALSMSTAAIGQMAIQEAGLQSAQQTRTIQESIINIGSGALLAAFIGTGAAKLLSAGERKALEKALAKNREIIGGPQALSAAPSDMRTGKLRPLVPAVVSKAYNKGREALGKVPYVGTALSKIAGFPESIALKSNPLLRMATSESTAARRAVGDLASLPLETIDNELGIATSKFGIPLDLDIKLTHHKAQVDLYEGTQKLFSDYRFGDQVRFPAARSYLEKRFGRSDGMTFEEFLQEVDVALRNRDQHPVPQVQEAALKFRKWFDVIKEAAKEAGIDIGDEVLGADSFAPRVYDRVALTRERPEFVRRYTEWRLGDQSKKRVLRDNLSREWDIFMRNRASARKIESRIATAERRLSNVEARLSERKMESTAALTRDISATDRLKQATAAVDEMKQFIADLKEVGDTAEIRAQIADLERSIKDIEAAATPIDIADLEAIDKAERDGVLVGPMRRVARILSGKSRQLPEPPSFWKWVADRGGVKDDGRDLRSVVDAKKPGLFNSKGLQWDDLQEMLAQEFPELRARWYRIGPAEDFSDEIRADLVNSVDGKQPEWFLAEKWDDDDRFVYEWVAMLDQAADEVGITFKSMNDVADFMNGDPVGNLTEADFDRMVAAIEDSGAGTDAAIEAMGLQERVSIRKQTVELFKSTLEKSKARLASNKVAEKVSKAAKKETSIASSRNLGRLGILNQRAMTAQSVRDALAVAKDVSRSVEERQLARIEDILNSWEGKSASDAKSAMKARAEYDLSRTPEQKSAKPRLGSADKAISRAVKRILRNADDKSIQEIQAEAEQTVNEILSTPDGRLPKDEPGTVSGFRKNADLGDVRGSLNARKLPMPDNDLLPFLVRNPIDYTMRYLRQSLSDLGMIARFGDTDGSAVLKEIADDYAKLIRDAPDQAARERLQKAMDRDIRDFAAMRDRIKGTYGFSDDAFLQTAGRVAESLKDFNVATLGGGFGLAQFPDFAGVVFRNGFGSALKDAWLPFFGRLTKMKDGGLRAVAGEWASIGVGAESFIHSRMMDAMDVSDIYHHKTPFERTLRMTGSAVANLSGINMITDVQKIMAASAASNNILRFCQAVSDGSATKKQITSLAAGGIDPDMAARIWSNYSNGGGAMVNDAMQPNLADWKDAVAARRFEAAVMREVEIAVITPGQEKPLFLSSPIVSLLGQFKTFVASANTRILLANLQRRDANALSGLIAQVSLGMVSYAAYTVAKGGQFHDRPQDWFKEGIDRSAVTGWFGELNMMAAKATGGQADLFRLIGADKPLSRYVSRGLLGNLLGPSAGKFDNATGVIYAVSNGQWTESDTRKLRQLIPFQNLFYVRLLFDQVEKNSNSLFGIEPKAANDR